MKSPFKTMFLALGIVLMSMPAFADGKSGKYKLNKVPRDISKSVAHALKVLGYKATPDTILYITTGDCPIDCNDKVAGGACLCDKVDGKCPGDSTEVGGDNPGKECRIIPKKATVIGGSGSGYHGSELQILMN